MNWQLEHIPNICQDTQEENFTCVAIYSFYTSSLIWGTIGPAKMYGMHALYNKCLYGFLLGALLPILFFVLGRLRFPRLKYVYTPVLLAGGIGWGPLNLSWLIPPLIVGYIFQVNIRRKNFDWWANCNVFTHPISSILFFSDLFCAVSYIERIDVRISVSAAILVFCIAIPWG